MKKMTSIVLAAAMLLGTATVSHAASLQKPKSIRKSAVSVETDYRDKNGKLIPGVYDAYVQCGLGQVDILAEVGSVRAEATHAQAEREERLSHGAEEHVTIHFTEIRLQQELDAVTRSRQGDGADGQNDEQDKQHRHHDLRGLFDAFLYSLYHDEMGHQHERQHPQGGTPRVGRQVVEGGNEAVGCLPGKTVGGRLHDVVERPARHHGIIPQYQEACQHTHTSYPFPWRAGRQYLIGPRRIGA